MADEVVQHYLYITSSYPAETYIKDGDTTNPITVNGTEVTVTPGDYVRVKNYQKDDPMVIDYVNTYNEDYPDYYEDCTPLYVYTNDDNWIYTGLYHRLQDNYNFRGKNIFNSSAYSVNFLDTVDNWAHEDSDILGKTSNQVVVRLATYEEQGEDPDTYHSTYFIEDMDTHYKDYGTWQETGTEETSNTITIEAQYGDFADFAQYHENWTEWSGWYINAVYQYPGVWVAADQYPDLTINPEPPQVKSHVQLKWTDPPDLPDWDPYPCTWEGTVIVRKEDSPPLHRWDGEKIVRTTTRDKYKTEPYKDEDIVSGKTYYYAFMPYYTRYEDPDHPIRFYTFTKVIKVEIGDKSLSSTIDSIDVDGIDATINYTLSQPDGGSFTSIKMYGKIGKNPKCDNTDDVIEDVDSSSTTLSLTGLTGNKVYYFCLVTMDTNNKKLSSNVKEARTITTVITFNNAIAFPKDNTVVRCFNYWWAGAQDYTISQLKGTFNNTFILLWENNNTKAYYICPYNINDGDSIYFGSNVYLDQQTGTTDDYYGMNCPSSLGNYGGAGSSLNRTNNFSGITKNNIHYTITGGSNEHPMYVVTSRSNISVYVDGTLQEVLNPS